MVVLARERRARGDCSGWDCECGGGDDGAEMTKAVVRVQWSGAGVRTGVGRDSKRKEMRIRPARQSKKDNEVAP
jgi:hypothetical protein